MLVVCVDECYEGGGNEEVGPGFGGGGVDGRYKLAEFEYSQQYLFFWDKLEKANCRYPDRGGADGRFFGVYD